MNLSTVQTFVSQVDCLYNYLQIILCTSHFLWEKCSIFKIYFENRFWATVKHFPMMFFRTEVCSGRFWTLVSSSTKSSKVRCSPVSISDFTVETDRTSKSSTELACSTWTTISLFDFCNCLVALLTSFLLTNFALGVFAGNLNMVWQCDAPFLCFGFV